MHPHDETFAAQVRTVREHLGLSQTDLAQSMTTRGHDFRQQTIYKIETGIRRVTFGEAVDIAASLGLTLEDMVSDESSRDLNVALTRVDQEREALQQAGHDYAFTLFRMAAIADKAKSLTESEAETVRDAIELESPAMCLRLEGLDKSPQQRLVASNLDTTGDFVQLLVKCIHRDDEAMRTAALDAIYRK